MFLAVVALAGMSLLSPLNVRAAGIRTVSKSTSDNTSNAASCPQLPANFDPLHALLDELRRFRLPPRPSDPVQQADWLQRMKTIKRIVCESTFTHTNYQISRLPASTNGAVSPNVLTGTSYNWSGYEVLAGPFDDVKGNWNTQCIDTSHFAYGEHILTWVGVGGVNGNTLVQVGTLWTPNAINGHSSGDYLWYEFPGHYGFTVDWNDRLGCAAPITAEVYYATYPYSQWCVDISAGTTAFPYCFDPSYTTNQATAEWIDERPNCANTGLSPLADFRYTQFSNAYAHSTARDWHTLAGSNPQAETMSDGQGEYAHPDNPLPSATTFSDHWDGLGYGSACYQF